MTSRFNNSHTRSTSGFDGLGANVDPFASSGGGGDQQHHHLGSSSSSPPSAAILSPNGFSPLLVTTQQTTTMARQNSSGGDAGMSAATTMFHNRSASSGTVAIHDDDSNVDGSTPPPMSPAVLSTMAVPTGRSMKCDADDDTSSVDSKLDDDTSRDVVRQWFNSIPCRFFHWFILVTTLLLFFVTFLHRRAIHHPFYLLTEGVITLLFVGEVGCRWYISRTHFCASRSNVVEAGICLLCAVSFLAVALHTLMAADTPTTAVDPATGSTVGQNGGSTKEEHEIVFALRFMAQVLRVSIYYRSTVRMERQTEMLVVNH